MAETEPSVAPDERLREGKGRRTNREVDEEDPVPAQRLGQQPARKKPERAAGDRDEHVGAHRPRSLADLRKLGDDDREDDRGLRCRADALQEPGADQHSLAGREAAQQRSGCEDRQAGEEHALSSGEVAKPTGEEQQAPEGDEEGVDDPGEVRLAEVEVALDEGQRDVHDRDVEDDHQLRQAHDGERRPLPAVGCGSGGGSEVHAGPCRGWNFGLKWRPPPE